MIDININLNKENFRGWIQNDGGGGTIQQVISENKGASVVFDFDKIDEWQKFIDLFNVTNITDMRLVKD